MLWSSWVFSQDLQEGFDLLNNQEYFRAKLFFKTIIDDDIDNITAWICYGRATGLGGDPKRGLEIFEVLNKQFPDNYEIGLNLGESLLWNEKYTQAIAVYKHLIDIDSTNFVSNYGIANGYAAIKNHEKAIYYNQKALEISKSDPAAINARKFILLGYAYDQFLDRKFENAETILDTLDFYYPNEIKSTELRQEVIKSGLSSISLFGKFENDDIGNNSKSQWLNTQINLSNNVQFDGRFSIRQLDHKSGTATANQKLGQVGLNYYFSQTTKLSAHLGLNSIITNENSIPLAMTYEAKFNTNIFGNQYFSLSYNKEIFNYSARTIPLNIHFNHIGVEHNLPITSFMAMYNNFKFSRISDSNKRRSLFSSLYFYTPGNWLKAGFNHLIMKCDFDRSEIYYSPLNFRSRELFVSSEGKLLDKKLTYLVSVAYGQQKDENSSWRLSKRIEAKTSYELTQNIVVSASYLTSNISQDLNIGNYSYNAITFGLTTQF